MLKLVCRPVSLEETLTRLAGMDLIEVIFYRTEEESLDRKMIPEWKELWQFHFVNLVRVMKVTLAEQTILK